MAKEPTLPERFLNVFQGDVRNNVIAFSRWLWERDSDVFLFMARKAACFFDCLRELKLADVRGVALSDRVLDMDLSFLRGKRVTLVDDCVFTGTTLYNARNAVLQAGCSQFDTMALAVNMDSIRLNLLPGGDEADDLRITQPIYGLSDSDCVRQCYDIVRAVSLIPRPYDVDFPHSRTIKLKDDAFDAILHLPGWTAFDATSDFQKANQVRAFSLLPNPHIHGAFCDLHSGDMVRLPAAKLRVYARQTASMSWSVRLVPIVMFPAIDDDQVLKALEDAAPRSLDIVSVCGLSTPQARYRMLHFLLAHSLLDFFSGIAAAPLSLMLPTEIRPDLMEMSFGIGAWQKYGECWPKRDGIALPPVHVGTTSSHTATFDGTPTTVDDPMATVSESLAPFTWLYTERELSTRAFVKENGLREGKTQGFSHINRLLEGFTPGFLFGRIQNPAVDIPTHISCLLDRFIDIGIAVPTIVRANGACCRAFRHGEDAVLGEAQERMLLQALKAYLEARGVPDIWGLELQKFVVLFVQIAIRNGLLDRLNMLPTVPVGAQVVSVKGHLHGPIPTVTVVSDPSGNIGPPFVAGNEAHPRWLVDSWVRRGYLNHARGERGTRYAIAAMPKLSVGMRGEAQSRQIGRCLGTACSHAGVRVDHDLVLLSTCAEPDHQIRALSGEIAIFRERWPRLSEHLRAAVRARRYNEARIDLRRKDDVFVAVNSGARKYQWYAKGTFDEVVNRTTQALQKIDGGAMADQWVLLWPQTQAFGKDNPSFIWRSITECGRWLMSANVAMRLLDYWIAVLGHKAGTLADAEVTAAAEDLKQWIPQLQAAFTGQRLPPFVELMSEVLATVDKRDEGDAYRWCEEAGKVLTLFAQRNAKLLLDEATVICNAYGAIDTAQNYPYAVFFDAAPNVPGGDAVLRKAMEQGLAACKPDAHQYLNDNQNPWRTGRWVLFSGNRNASTATVFCLSVAAHLARVGLPFRAALIGQLATDDCIRTFSHSTAFADGQFFRRLAELRPHVLSVTYDNTIGFANEHHANFDDERDKFLKLTANKGPCASAVTVTLGEADVPSKEFVVSMVNVPSVEHRSQESTDTQTSEATTSQTPPTTVLLCTATDKEDDAMEEYLKAWPFDTKVAPMAKGTYKEVDMAGQVRVMWVRSSMGSQGPGGALATTMDAIDDIRPDYVISCGLAFGHDPEKQHIGDVLVAEWVHGYDAGRQEPGKFIPRGHRAPADPFLVQVASLVRRDMLPLRVTLGGFLSGGKLVDDPEFKKAIWTIEPEAIGGDMEGIGILDACVRRQRRWIVVKAICDWGEKKNSDAQPGAAANAIRVVFAMIDSGGLLRR